MGVVSQLGVVYSQLDESEGDDREMRVNRCDVLCGGGDRLRVWFSVRPTHRERAVQAAAGPAQERKPSTETFDTPFRFLHLKVLSTLTHVNF